jgi:hypothetical protein
MNWRKPKEEAHFCRIGYVRLKWRGNTDFYVTQMTVRNVRFYKLKKIMFAFALTVKKAFHSFF